MQVLGTIYQCEGCGYSCTDRQVVLECEAKGVKSEFTVGDTVQFTELPAAGYAEHRRSMRLFAGQPTAPKEQPIHQGVIERVSPESRTHAIHYRIRATDTGLGEPPEGIPLDIHEVCVIGLIVPAPAPL